MPEQLTLPSLKTAAADCKGCDLWKKGTQTVFGEGKRRATALFVGEQPGNEEDLTGKPFVGPAGRIFDSALEEAGINRQQTYVTNVVKHFKWEPRGKRRIHKKPNSQEINACRPWLEAEIAVVKPQVVVALGATAAQALLGAQFRVTKNRGEFLEWAEVHGNYYGTSRLTVEQEMKTGTDILLEIDWQGARQVKKQFPQAAGIFILPPSIAALEERLHKRGTDEPHIITRRLLAAGGEIAHAPEFEYAIINEEFNVALSELQAIVKATRSRFAQQAARNASLFAQLGIHVQQQS